MKSLIVPLAALGVLAATAGTALAAPPAYCALYAREYANQFALAAGEKPDSEPKIQDEAYYRCLNMDQAPAMPVGSAYYGTTVNASGQIVTPDAAASAAPATGNAPASTANSGTAPSPSGTNTATTPAPTTPQPAASTVTPPVPAAPPKPVSRTANVTPSAHSYTGGKTPWTPEWFAACKKYFPNSFNEKDGTILPHGANKRVFCR